MPNYNNKIERDNNLDTYRGCAMIYIVGIIHIIGYWVDFNVYNTLSLMLIVMPILFYISGASYALSSKKSYGQYLKNRIKRIIIPLLVYLTIYTTYNTIKGELQPLQIPGTILKYAYNIIFTGNIMELDPLWYLQPYIIIALLLPLLYYVSQRVTPLGTYIVLLLNLVCIYFFPGYIPCYIVATYAGLYYTRTKPYNSWVVLAIFVAAIILWIVQGNTWNIQYNKFPPTIMYLSYTSCMLILFGTPLKWLCQQATRIPMLRYIINHYAQHSYSIYLYHFNVMRVVHTIYYVICLKLFDNHPLLMHPACSLTIIGIATLLALIPLTMAIAPINNAAERCISAIWHKAKDLGKKDKRNNNEG